MEVHVRSGHPYTYFKALQPLGRDGWDGMGWDGSIGKKATDGVELLVCTYSMYCAVHAVE